MQGFLKSSHKISLKADQIVLVRARYSRAQWLINSSNPDLSIWSTLHSPQDKTVKCKYLTYHFLFTFNAIVFFILAQNYFYTFDWFKEG